jgi:hypothetical protein
MHHGFSLFIDAPRCFAAFRSVEAPGRAPTFLVSVAATDESIWLLRTSGPFGQVRDQVSINLARAGGGARWPPGLRCRGLHRVDGRGNFHRLGLCDLVLLFECFEIMAILRIAPLGRVVRQAVTRSGSRSGDELTRATG